jgi:hypothetical protein
MISTAFSKVLSTFASAGPAFRQDEVHMISEMTRMIPSERRIFSLRLI